MRSTRRCRGESKRKITSQDISKEVKDFLTITLNENSLLPARLVTIGTIGRMILTQPAEFTLAWNLLRESMSENVSAVQQL